MNLTWKALVALVISACASAPAPGPAVGTSSDRVTVGVNQTTEITHDLTYHEVRFTAPRTEVWKALLEAHAALGIPLVAADSVGGQLQYRTADARGRIGQRSASHYLDCGNGPAGARADTYQLRIEILQFLDTPQAGATRLRTQLLGSARSRDTSGDPIHCTTTNELEKEIAGMVSARLKP